VDRGDEGLHALLLERALALARATIVLGASLLTPAGFFGFLLVPLWLIVTGTWLSRSR
jgi:hypothetical protein